MNDLELRGMASLLGKLVREAKDELRAEFEQRFAQIPAPQTITNTILGERGPQGEPGPQGERGDTGDQGIPGPRGERGETGPTGKDGPVGPQGERGLPGESITGPQGPQGERGEQGLRGEKGEIGERGERGEKGTDGRDGRDGIGKDGIDGRDALEIELVTLEPYRSFPKRTFAVHNGALIRANRKTHPTEFNAQDWDVILEGWPVVEIKQSEDFRHFTIRCTRSGGTAAEQTFSVPVLLYRGIFKDGETYERGDGVTFSGNMWHCRAESTQDKPPSDAWTLMVREGRAGKDLRPAEPAPPNGPIRLK